ncbi:MAG: hypothetical protein ACRDVM_06955 [Acidimicrobiia bacterium]
MKHYRGTLAVAADPEAALPVRIAVEAHHLVILAEEKLGAWELDGVEVDRLEGDTFLLDLAGEKVMFVADDALDFAYGALPAIEAYRRRRGLRRRPKFPPRVQALPASPPAASPLPEPFPLPPPQPVARQSKERVSGTPVEVRPPRRDMAPPIFPAATLAERVGRMARAIRSELTARGMGRPADHHEHSYEERSVAGVLVRRICTICNHVSIGGGDSNGAPGVQRAPEGWRRD